MISSAPGIFGSINALLFSFFSRHSHSILRAQCNDCQRFDSVIWHKPHAPILSERGDEEDAFHPGEAFTDAAAWATAERKVSELRLASARFHSPALRVET